MLIEAFELNGRKFAIRDVGRTLRDTDMLAIEHALGFTLPSELRSFYLRWNGGLPFPMDVREFSSVCVRVVWPVGCGAASGGRIACVGYVQSFDSGSEDFAQNWDAYKNWLPHDVLPFQRDPGDSQFLIGTAPTNLGKIFYWPRGYGPDLEAGEVPSYDNIATVAPSFLEFLALYREEPQPGESEEDWIRRNYGDV